MVNHFLSELHRTGHIHCENYAKYETQACMVYRNGPFRKHRAEILKIMRACRQPTRVASPHRYAGYNRMHCLLQSYIHSTHFPLSPVSRMKALRCYTTSSYIPGCHWKRTYPLRVPRIPQLQTDLVCRQPGITNNNHVEYGLYK